MASLFSGKWYQNVPGLKYICPHGHQMHTNGTWQHHSNKRKGKYPYRFQRYTTHGCKGFAGRHLCTKSNPNGRYIDRSEYAEIIDANTKRVNANPEYYRERQQITEHQFGTLKRLGFTHTNIRGKDNVIGEVGILFIGYNLRRCISILGVEGLIKALGESCFDSFDHRFIMEILKKRVNDGSINRLMPVFPKTLWKKKLRVYSPICVKTGWRDPI